MQSIFSWDKIIDSKETNELSKSGLRRLIYEKDAPPPQRDYENVEHLSSAFYDDCDYERDYKKH